MAPIFGFGFLLSVVVTSFIVAIFTTLSVKKLFFRFTYKQIVKISGFFALFTAFCAISAQLCLIYSYIASDYSVANVYYNSHISKPLIYKIAGSWGNHEGSMLLLISILSLYNVAFIFRSKCSDIEKLTINCCQSLILLGVATFSIYTSNPFLAIFPVPTEGLGLNPILQDIGLAMHPPMLYLGYIGFSLIFSFAVSGLLLEKIDQQFAKNIKNWLYFSLGILTLGIGLGSWWAYRELGWGGYWFWDPVENISLMPWLAGAALMHCIVLLEKRGGFAVWTALLAIISFILCLIGIFLVRSGVLTSIHSFAIDAKRGFFIILLILIIGCSGLLIFALKASKIKSSSKNSDTSFLSKTSMILINNYFLILSLLIIFLGTLYPIFSQFIFNASISIGPDYYNRVFSLLIIPFLAFLTTSYYLKLPKVILLIFAVITCAIFIQTQFEPMALIVVVLSIFAAFGIILSFFLNKDFMAKFASNLSHIGFVFIIIGVSTSSLLGATKEVNIKKGEVVKIANFEIKFTDARYIGGKNYIARQGIFDIFKNQKLYATLNPELRYFEVSDKTTFEAAIKNGIFGDLYLALGNKDAADFYALRIYYKPLVSFIWLGCLMIFVGIISRIPLTQIRH